MKIAILGATSQIAKDLIVSFATHTDHQCTLFSRVPAKVEVWQQSIPVECDFISKPYENFSTGNYDVIINFVGVGNPARAKEMGAKIFDITYQYDQLALDYIQVNPACKYIFLSSGAVYGDIFSEPATESSVARIPVNQLDGTYWYTIAKLHAEARHRALPERSIVDVRVFNYFSHTQDMSASFFITDVVRAIQNETVLKTSSENIVRDFLHPSDFFQLINVLLLAPAVNIAVDCYTQAPVNKISLLETMQEEFGLRYEVSTAKSMDLNATGRKSYYYSLNRCAEDFGYEPNWDSLSGILHESRVMFEA